MVYNRSNVRHAKSFELSVLYSKTPCEFSLAKWGFLQEQRTSGMLAAVAVWELHSQWRLWADNVGCTASVQIDAAQARRMDMRSDQERSDRAGDGTEEVRFPRHAGLARKNAPENGAVEQTDHQCRAQRDQ